MASSRLRMKTMAKAVVPAKTATAPTALMTRNGNTSESELMKFTFKSLSAKPWIRPPKVRLTNIVRAPNKKPEVPGHIPQLKIDAGHARHHIIKKPRRASC